MIPLLVVVGWGLLALATLLWLLAATGEPQPAGAPVDPYEGEAARFRRELHDWDREGRP